MKNIFYILFVTIITLCSCSKTSKQDIDADIIIFTQQGCSHCEKAVDFINNDLLVKNPSLRVTQIDISYDMENIKILKHYLEKYKFHKSTVGTPIIIFNDKLVMGWGIENKVGLKKAFYPKL